MWWASVLSGSVVGLSLGLTGGGGAIFAVPLLVYVLELPASQAVGVSLITVGVAAAVGLARRWWQGQVEVSAGLLFAIAGMLGAPVGTWISMVIPEVWLMSAFAILMLIVSLRMWRQASAGPASESCPPVADADGPTCRRDAQGRLIVTSRCAMLLWWVGIAVGVLSGLFGVGGGFIIVPALIFFSGLSMSRAVGTSLMVIALVSLAGLGSQWWAGRSFPAAITGWFMLGGVAGMFVGQSIGQHISGPVLQKGFAIAILAVATFVIVRNTLPVHKEPTHVPDKTSSSRRGGGRHGGYYCCRSADAWLGTVPGHRHYRAFG